MICNILLRLPNTIPFVIYSSNNFNETISEFEMIALDMIQNIGGEQTRKIINNKDFEKMKKRSGYYCVNNLNKIMIYKKEKNGWIYNGELKLLREYEFICYRKNRKLDIFINNEYDNCLEYVFKELLEKTQNTDTNQNTDF